MFAAMLAPAIAAAQTPSIEITIGPGGRVAWNGAPLTGDAAITAKLADGAQATPKQPLRLTPINGAQTADLMHVLMLTQPFHYQISIVKRPSP